ncbi:LOW QUALITY PROTEIN: splicing factor 1-like [Patiria miniata]|uniref:Splicing factor 1 n=1 Tax=Patiria miniata TaxID=46514 RepID=A0A913ZJY3_PATMI|nr:LOW QUALITY PROTEIN: splicing factor 1-like [Patiria miniata]
MAGTGANSIPLGALHPILRGQKPPGGIGVGITGPIGGGGESSMLNAAREAAARVTANIMGKRPPPTGPSTGGPGGPGKSIDSTNWPPDKKRKRSRWGGEDTKPAGVASIIPSGLSKDQEKQVLMHLQVEEISRQLRSGDLGIPATEDRSPSPEPVYNHEGKRLNTREYRTRKKLEEQRHILIQEAMLINPDYKPPADYKPPIQRVSDRVMIPQDDHPDINFVGLLIGPRGNTLKKLEKDTGTKVMIRGKGSVKEGKVGRKDGQPLPGEDEPLHALVTANTSEAVKKAVDQIREIIKQGIETPEGQNDLRRMQLRELARLNGTLRDEDTTRCSNCGALTHRTWQCPEKQNITGTIVCTICGGTGHIAQDCRAKFDGSDEMGGPMGGGPMGGPNGGPPRMAGPSAAEKAKMDSEYMCLMAELGEGPPPSEPKMNMPPPLHSQQGPPNMGGPRPLLSTPPNQNPHQNHQNQPRPLMGQSFQPPWMSKDHHGPPMPNKPPSLLGMPHPHHHRGPPGGGGGGPPGPPGPPHPSGPPPPNFGGPPPPGGPPGQFNMNQPPPGLLPPPMMQPPPGMMNMPPHGMGGGNPPPWGMPPPPPASQQPTATSTNVTLATALPTMAEMQALAMPVPPPPTSLLAAPPPPPPSSEPPPPPLPTSTAPWQVATSAGGRPVVTSTGPVTTPPWQRIAQEGGLAVGVSMANLPWQQPTAPATTASAVTAAAWQQLLQQQQQAQAGAATTADFHNHHPSNEHPGVTDHSPTPAAVGRLASPSTDAVPAPNGHAPAVGPLTHVPAPHAPGPPTPSAGAVGIQPAPTPAVTNALCPGAAPSTATPILAQTIAHKTVAGSMVTSLGLYYKFTRRAKLPVKQKINAEQTYVSTIKR